MDESKSAAPVEPDNPDALLAPNSDIDALSAEPAEATASLQPIAGADTPPIETAPLPVPPRPGGFKRLFGRLNIYLILYIVVLLLAGAIILVTYLESKKISGNGGPGALKTQTLTQSTLDQLANSDATVGNSQQVLTVQSNAIFAGKVLIRDSLEVAGSLRLGGTAAFNNLTASGTSQLADVQINKSLSVAGDTGIQGAATVAKSLQVNGSGSFNGAVSAPQITTSSLQLNGDLVLNHHITAGGGTPGRSGGSALGSGGSASVSGSDTAGNVSINIGSSPPAGCFVTVNFTSKYNATPHILLTPVGSGAGGLAYYVTRTPASFSVCDASAPSAGASFSFDYFVVD